MKRMWNSDENHLSPHAHPLKSKIKKPKTKGTKADSVEKVTVAELLPELENTKFHLDEQPYSSLFKIYQKEFLDISVSKGLIHTDALALAGDDTPVVTSHRERKKLICNCKEKGLSDCKCDRYFSPPDCDIGWDSSRDCYYHEYDLYILVDSQSDLPVFPHFSCASKHDSHGFLHAFFRMKSFLPDYTVSKVLLDFAHDAMPYYQYFKRENITPFIDLNGKGGIPPVYKNDFTIDKDGTPVCLSRCRMRRDSVETAKGRMKFKKVDSKNGIILFKLYTLFRHSDNRYVYFSYPFLSFSDNIHFSMSIVSYADHNHSGFREIINIVKNYTIFQHFTIQTARIAL